MEREPLVDDLPRLVRPGPGLVLAAPVNGGPTQLLGSAHQVVLLGWPGQLGLVGGFGRFGGESDAAIGS